jgi:hypothetical protein
MLVFIDESGDAGFKLTKGSAKTFVAALVAFRDPASAAAACAVIEIVTPLGAAMTNASLFCNK